MKQRNENYQVVHLPIEKIKPDPKQPRKSFVPEELKALSESLKLHGFIKAIEIDETGVIVTGERRYRAAKLAGLSSIPCRIINIKSDERLERQVHENIHQSGMNAIDVARVLRWYRNRGWTVEKIAKRFGIGCAVANSFLRTLALPEDMQEVVRKANFRRSFLQPLMRIYDEEVRGAIPKGYSRRILGKLIQGEIESVHGFEAFAHSVQENPLQAEKYASINFRGKDYREVKTMLDVVSPRKETQANRNIENAKRVLRLINSLNALVATEHGLHAFPIRYRKKIADGLIQLGRETPKLTKGI